MSLLNEAKKIKTQRTVNRYNNEHFELAIAFLKGEITQRQAQSVLKIESPSNLRHVMTTILRHGVLNDKIFIKIKK